jgi:hypothetical protein
MRNTLISGVPSTISGALIKTLKARGVSSELTAMIKSYLTDREVEFTQGSETVRKLCTKGCPQGSVLGPTLWT